MKTRLFVWAVMGVSLVYAGSRDDYHQCSGGLPKLEEEEAGYHDYSPLDQYVVSTATLAAAKMEKNLISVTAARSKNADGTTEYKMVVILSKEAPQNPGHKSVCIIHVKEDGEALSEESCRSCYQ